MKTMRLLCLTFLLAAFTLSSVAGSALAACNCMHDEQAVMQMGVDHEGMDMPCHQAAKKDETKHQHAQKDKAPMKCDSCGCGDCNITSHSALVSPMAHPMPVLSGSQQIATSNPLVSFIPHGIDYPPRPLS